MQKNPHSIKDSKFFLVTHFDGQGWSDDEVVEQSPINRVRQLLGGRWETSKEYPDIPMKVFYNGQRRVAVIGFKPEWTQSQVLEALQQIKDGREDRN